MNTDGHGFDVVDGTTKDTDHTKEQRVGSWGGRSSI